MKYRAEIDGLRAVAVTIIIFFHADFGFFKGGFIGVDVFFVISGYLITSLILAQIATDSFTLTGFYQRRARRIMPALLFVTILCVPFAWLLMSPDDLKDFSKSLIAVPLFVSNVLFWKSTGYFDPAAELKPLLHTWSLAVEEQYYLLFPFIFLMMWKRWRAWIAGILVVVAVASLAGGYWSSKTDAAAAFYLLPSRLWEILSGAVVAFYLHNDPRFGEPKKLSDEIVSAGGLLLIICACLLKPTAFPGPASLLAVAGAIAIIAHAKDRTLIGRLLGHKQIVGVGLISYSAYLWHVPLFAFARHISFEQPPRWVFACLCIVALLMAYLSWRHIETPFRISASIPKKPFVVTVVAASLLAVSLGFWANQTDGFQQTYYASLPQTERLVFRSIQEDIRLWNGKGYPEVTGECIWQAIAVDERFISRFDRCAGRYGKAKVILGDSHSGDVFRSLAYANFSPFLIRLGQGGCRAHNPPPQCQFSAIAGFLIERSKSLDAVVYVQAGFRLLKDEHGGEMDNVSMRSIDARSLIVSDLGRIKEVVHFLMSQFLP